MIEPHNHHWLMLDDERVERSGAFVVCVCVWYLSHKDAVLLWWPGLVPYRQLQHVVAEIPAMDMSVDERLVPLGLTSLLHCFCPSFALVTVLNNADSTGLLSRWHGFRFRVNLSQPAVLACPNLASLCVQSTEKIWERALNPGFKDGAFEWFLNADWRWI